MAWGDSDLAPGYAKETPSGIFRDLAWGASDPDLDGSDTPGGISGSDTPSGIFGVGSGGLDDEASLFSSVSLLTPSLPPPPASMDTPPSRGAGAWPGSGSRDAPTSG